MQTSRELVFSLGDKYITNAVEILDYREFYFYFHFTF